MVIKILGTLAVAAAMLIPAATARADQPAVRGCVGASISQAARSDGRFGGFVDGLAHDGSGVGLSDNVHTLAAGGYPDDVFPNSCN